MKRFALLIVVLCFYITNASAQTDVNKDIDVAKVYEQVVKEGYGTPKVYLKLANAYYFEGQYQDAKKWFEKVFENEKPTDKKLLFRYKQTLKALKMNVDKNPFLAVSSGGTN